MLYIWVYLEWEDVLHSDEEIYSFWDKTQEFNK